MAFRKSSKGRKPDLSISTSFMVRKGQYKKGVSFGLWSREEGPVKASGSVSGEYLDSLIEFCQKVADRDGSVNFALFENDAFDKKRRREEEEEEDDEGEEEEDDEEEEEKKPARGKAGKPTDKKPAGKKSKKDDWDFDD